MEKLKYFFFCRKVSLSIPGYETCLVMYLRVNGKVGRRIDNTMAKRNMSCVLFYACMNKQDVLNISVSVIISG